MHRSIAAIRRLLGRPKSLDEGQASDQAGAVDPAGLLAPIRQAATGWARHNDVERLIPIVICGLLASAVLIGALPEASPAVAAPRPTQAPVQGAAAPFAVYGQGDGPLAANYSDIYLGDGTIPNTLQNPGVGIDAKTQLRTYTVKAGDTLGEIAGQFGLATSTIYWANKASLPDPSAIRVGQQLLIPPMDGLLVTVGAKDTLDTLAAKYKVATSDIIDANNLPDTNVVVGQTLLIPGASGGAMPAPKAGSGGGRSVSAGSWLWPVGGYNFISQYFWSGHHAIDIAAGEGTPVIAAVGGTVVLAGYRGYTGGGNVIWVQQGTKLYTTYNHLSRWAVKNGQRISAGQVIGYVGHTGEATGPHLHFEVWLGYPWALGNVSDAVNPCLYLAGC